VFYQNFRLTAQAFATFCTIFSAIKLVQYEIQVVQTYSGTKPLAIRKLCLASIKAFFDSANITGISVVLKGSAMQVFEWQEKYNLGLDLIDDQHKVLVRIINDLDNLLDINFSKEKLASLITELVDYTKFHFSTEERLMKTRGYNGTCLKAHIHQHQQFVEEIQSFISESDSYNKKEAEWVFKYLTNWLINHILKVDRHLVDHLKQQEKAQLNPPKAHLEKSLHQAESLYNEIGATLDRLKEESYQRSANYCKADQLNIVNQLKSELDEVSVLLEKALDHASLANKATKHEKFQS